jgi:hypothetical protein
VVDTLGDHRSCCRDYRNQRHFKRGTQRRKPTPATGGGTMNKPHEIITDDEIIRVHGHANFGAMSPREVVNDGVRQYAFGFTGGSTQVAILIAHGLITKPKKFGGAHADLTETGKLYGRSIYQIRRHGMTDDHTRKIKLDTLREVQKVLAFEMDDMSTLARTTAANAISKMIEELL